MMLKNDDNSGAKTNDFDNLSNVNIKPKITKLITITNISIKSNSP